MDALYDALRGFLSAAGLQVWHGDDVPEGVSPPCLLFQFTQRAEDFSTLTIHLWAKEGLENCLQLSAPLRRALGKGRLLRFDGGCVALWSDTCLYRRDALRPHLGELTLTWQAKVYTDTEEAAAHAE